MSIEGYRQQFLRQPNPYRPSEKRLHVFCCINELAEEAVTDTAMWMHDCSFESLQEWDKARLDRPEAKRFDDPPGYFRQDDFLYESNANKLNWSAFTIEKLRFKNASDYLRRLSLLADGVSNLDADARDAVHPNKFGTSSNLSAMILKRSDWRGELRPRYAAVTGKTMSFFEKHGDSKPKLTFSLLGCEVKGYDATAANTNQACDLYGLGFTEDQARRTLRLRPENRVPFFIVLPTYEERILWLSTLKRKAEYESDGKKNDSLSTKVKKSLLGTFLDKKKLLPK